MKRYDVIVIGTGCTGLAIARELAFFDAKVCVIEKEEDICSGTSKANSAICHTGFDAKPGTLKAKMNIEGARLMEKLSQDLEFSYINNGHYVLCFNEEDKPALQELLERGIKNGVEKLEIISGEELRKREPHISKEVVCALSAPTGAIICPFELCEAFAENAAINGCEFIFNEEVKSIRKENDNWIINDEYECKVVVNAAGLYSDTLHNLVSNKKYHITPRSGNYLLMDNDIGDYVHSTIFQLPTHLGKAILVSPTVHGNLLIGPTAVDRNNKDDISTTADELKDVIEKSKLSCEGIPYNKVITSFSGLRAHEDGGDFILNECEDAENFFDCVGIESPGLSSAPAIGKLISEEVSNKLNLKRKTNVIETRKRIPHLKSLSIEERKRLIEVNPLYGNIICRCEEISEGEIVDAISRVPGATSLDGVKRRVRAGMGRCQAGFCMPKVLDILSRELNKPMNEIKKNSNGSNVVIEKMEDR